MDIDTVAFVKFLANQSNNVTFHEDGASEKIRALFSLVQREAEALRGYYGACQLAEADPAGWTAGVAGSARRPGIP